MSKNKQQASLDKEVLRPLARDFSIAFTANMMGVQFASAAKTKGDFEPGELWYRLAGLAYEGWQKYMEEFDRLVTALPDRPSGQSGDQSPSPTRVGRSEDDHKAARPRRAGATVTKAGRPKPPL
jgi:hypothetical protein